MIITSHEYVWEKSHKAYHLTERKNLLNIKKQGLITLCGERSNLIGDTRKAIYFFDDITQASDWQEWLYPTVSYEELILLSFNLKGIKFYIRDIENGDFYINQNISPQNLYYLTILQGKKEVSLKYLMSTRNKSKVYQLCWRKIRTYPDN